MVKGGCFNLSSGSKTVMQYEGRHIKVILYAQNVPFLANPEHGRELN